MLFIVNDHGIGIEVFPQRKKHCLTVRSGNTSIKVASFNNQESAELFAKELEKMFVEMGCRIEREKEESNG